MSADLAFTTTVEPWPALAAPHEPFEAQPQLGQRLPAPTAALATIGHELRGPLHALGASATMLAEDFDSLSPEQVRQVARAIQRRALWLQGLTENLLTAATLERGG